MRPEPNDLPSMPRVPFPLDDVSTRLALVGCGKSKLDDEFLHEAGELYTGTYFREVLEACRRVYADVFILSAKYGVIHPTARIRTYDVMLPWGLRKPGADEVVARFRRRCTWSPGCGWVALGHKVDIHAGRNYARWFQNHNPENAVIRWADWGQIGERRQKYKELQ